MTATKSARSRPRAAPVGPYKAEALAAINYGQLLEERLAELEMQLDSQGWQSVGGFGDTEFSRDALRNICKQARLYWLKNPLIQRGVNVQTYYVFGQGVSIRAEDEAVNEVVQAFLDDSANRVELTSQQAMMGKETELTLMGNLFFALFIDPATGRVRVRTLPIDEVESIIADPDDAKSPRWYKRVHGLAAVTYYRDWRWAGGGKPDDGKVGDAVIYHVKVGGLPDMQFGVPEVYAALDWAKAYKSFLEDWATIVRSYSRFAWKISAETATQVANAKAKLQTTLGATTSETNPPPVTGAAFIGKGNANIEPIRTAGATTSADDGRRLLLMVAATMGLPETFFGDASTGTLATARSLDRPTELKFAARRALWADVFNDLCRVAIIAAVKAGALAGTVTEEPDGTPALELEDVTDPDTGETAPRDPTVTVTYPPILEHDVVASVGAIVQAATLGSGGKVAGVIDPRTVSQLLLTALGVDDVDAAIEAAYPPEGTETPPEEQSAEEVPPEGGEQPVEPATAEPVMPTPEQAMAAQQEAFMEALGDLKRMVKAQESTP
jgi:hypothetical protein